MKTNEPGQLQPIAIHDYQLFRLYAKRAQLVTFETQYYDTPLAENFMEPVQHLKALRILAFGVSIDQLPFILTHTIQFPWTPYDAKDWETRVRKTGQQLAALIENLETDLQAIQGNPSPPSIRELWVKTLR
ncbi:MAG: hypothetical protein ACFFCO_00855 [Promethearchaeota archaeon]